MIFLGHKISLFSRNSFIHDYYIYILFPLFICLLEIKGWYDFLGSQDLFILKEFLYS